MTKKNFLYCILIATILAGCSKDYDIKLPPNKSEIVVECYLEDGQPLRALISESKGLLDTSRVPPLLQDALVIITHNNVKDTLRPIPYVDTVRRRVYNYTNPKLVVANHNSNEPYRIDVYDRKGRYAYGETRFLPLVQIDSLKPIFNNQQEAYCLAKFTDPNPSMPNYFLLLINKNVEYDSLSLDVLFDNGFANNNNQFVFGSGYDFKRGDKIYGTLYHLLPEYHLYLTTLQNARSALGNPFAVSGEVVSNVKGGLGVFTALSVTRKRVEVP